tara:strand:+ start:536 stop:751 length:216 start_codon:yes stop_codon:yes gene_type:complete
MVNDVVVEKLEEKESELSEKIETETQDYLDNNLEDQVKTIVKSTMLEDVKQQIRDVFKGGKNVNDKPSIQG